MNVKHLIALFLLASLGCSATGGNRAKGRPMVGRVGELKNAVGKVVTLVGTARTDGADGSAIDLMGGTVKLPAYTWPDDYIGRRVTVSGTVFDAAAEDLGHAGTPVYRLGEIESASMWSR